MPIEQNQFSSLTPAEMLFDRLQKKQNFEAELWKIADNLRANAKLKPSDYKTPVLALLFLRYASAKFEAARPDIEAKYAAQAGRMKIPLDEMFRTACGFFLPENARYEYLLAPPEGILDQDNQPVKPDETRKIVARAIDAFHEANPDLRDILPRDEFFKIPDATLREVLTNLGNLEMADGDRFGKIYEYFLSEFSKQQGEKGGEFYTPQSIVKLIVEVLEPHAGRFFDPACGSGGMFVQSAKFIRRAQDADANLFIFGQEKEPETSKLARLNLSINALRYDVREVDNSLAASTYTAENHFPVADQFDYVMANPPFNVDGVKTETPGEHPLFNRFGLPLNPVKSGKNPDTFSNSQANYLWISLFAAALNPQGRAGFVMANSASDARGAETDIRRRLVEAGMVDVMISVGSNFFYTVTLPVTLWFFDREKAADPARRHRTLFMDARKIFNQITRAHREFTYAQLQNLAAIVWLYRGETEKFEQLRRKYQACAEQWLLGGHTDPEGYLLNAGETFASLDDYADAATEALRDFAQKTTDWAIKLAPPTDNPPAPEALAAFHQNLKTLRETARFSDKKQLNDLHKQAEEALAFAEKTLRPDKDKTFAAAGIKTAFQNLAEARRRWVFVDERVAYFRQQLDWLDARFPDAAWRDVEGLCRIATAADIAEQGYSLNPGRYVGVAIEDDGMSAEDFRAFLLAQGDTLARLQTEAAALHGEIEKDIFSLAQAVLEKEVGG